MHTSSRSRTSSCKVTVLTGKPNGPRCSMCHTDLLLLHAKNDQLLYKLCKSTTPPNVVWDQELKISPQNTSKQGLCYRWWFEMSRITAERGANQHSDAILKPSPFITRCVSGDCRENQVQLVRDLSLNKSKWWLKRKLCCATEHRRVCCFCIIFYNGAFLASSISQLTGWHHCLEHRQCLCSTHWWQMSTDTRVHSTGPKNALSR